MTALSANLRTVPFAIRGEVSALSSELRKGGAEPGARAYTRPMGGWLATFGKLGPDGGIVPTVDRDGQVFEAARELGRIDWSPYLKGGKWNDTHDDKVIVGLPVSLEFHDGTTPLSKSHGKIGFWTTGRLFDRNDPSSWDGLGRRPTAHEFERADHFWSLAHLLKGLPRPIGLSAHGAYAASPCGKRIVYARVDEAAVCELPKNPDATLEALEKAVRAPDLLEVLAKGSRVPTAGGKPCGRCSCPPGACDGLLRKAVTAGGGTVPEDLEGVRGRPIVGPTTPDPDESVKGAQREALIERLQSRFLIDRPTAERWIAYWFRYHYSGENADKR